MSTDTLAEAIARADLDAARSAIESGAEVNAIGEDGWTPLCWAVDGGHVDLVPLLVAHGADVNHREADEGESVLILAAQYEDDDIAERLIDLLVHVGADVNLPDYMGWTPLVHAAANQRVGAVRALLRHGAHPDHRAAYKNGVGPAAREVRTSEAVRELFESP